MPKNNYNPPAASSNAPESKSPVNASTPAEREAAAIAEINQVLARYGSVLTRRNRGTMLDEHNGVRVEAVNEVPAVSPDSSVGAFPDNSRTDWSETIVTDDPDRG